MDFDELLTLYQQKLVATYEKSEGQPLLGTINIM